MKFYKLYTPPAGRKPETKISVYYRGLPLYADAVFEEDRYSFKLPLNLSDKMITGNLCADLCYAARTRGVAPIRTPVSLILSDRYD